MTSNEFFPTAPDDTRTEILEATYRALREHGYDALTIQKIGEEFDKSTSLLYHHYEGKDDLLVDFLDYMLERLEDDIPFETVDDPKGALETVLDHALAPSMEDEREEFARAMNELRSQATHDPAYREAFTRHDRFFHDRLTAILREGIDQGDFREVDPDRLAALLQATFNGAMTQRVTSDSEEREVSVEDVRAELEAVLETYLLEDTGE